MTTAAWILLSVAVVMSVVDWVAVARDHSVLEYVSKPAATVAFRGEADGGKLRGRCAALCGECLGAGVPRLGCPTDAL